MSPKYLSYPIIRSLKKVFKISKKKFFSKVFKKNSFLELNALIIINQSIHQLICNVL